MYLWRNKTNINIFTLNIRTQQRPRSACANVQSDQGLHCMLTESLDNIEFINEETVHTQGNLNLCILCMFTGTFSLDMAISLYHTVLTLKLPRKPASENVVCLCRLLNILANFSNLLLHTGKQCGP